MSEGDLSTAEARRLKAVEEALHKVQEQAAQLEELGEQVSLTVHALEVEVAALVRELRSRPAVEEQPGRTAPPIATPVPGTAEERMPTRSTDVEGARLVALNLALAGEPREATERYLAEHYELDGLAEVLDGVYTAAAGSLLGSSTSSSEK